MYTDIVVDVVNLGYKIFNEKDRIVSEIKSKKVYKNFIISYIETIQWLEKKYLEEGGSIYLLYDNYDSKELLKSSFTNDSPNSLKERKELLKEYKKNRKKETNYFYASLDFLKYYLSLCEDKYKIVYIHGLEADDLVKSCIEYIKSNHAVFRILLVTNDFDWYRYIEQDRVDILPDLVEDPFTYNDFLSKYKFPPSEEKVLLYRLFYGDKSDNIKAPLSSIPFTEEEILEILRKYNTVLDFVYDFMVNNPKYSKIIKEKEKDIRSCYQVSSTIPVSTLKFKTSCIKGRNSVLRSSIERLLFGSSEKKEFSFSKISTPRT